MNSPGASCGSKITDHSEIIKWVEARGGHPARVRATAKEDGGILRIDFNLPDQGLERLEWEDFFRIFDRKGLAMLKQDQIEESESKPGGFVEFVPR